MTVEVGLVAVIVAVVAFFAYQRGEANVYRQWFAEKCRAGDGPGLCGLGKDCTHHPSWRWTDGRGWEPRDKAASRGKATSD